VIDPGVVIMDHSIDDIEDLFLDPSPSSSSSSSAVDSSSHLFTETRNNRSRAFVMPRVLHHSVEGKSVAVVAVDQPNDSIIPG